MINVINNSTNPFINLALEEYFLKYKALKDDVLILWQNEPVVVVGKNQNTYEELNAEYIENKNIKVVRRLSGGGAVYHDLGNLNFTIIKNNAEVYRNDFSFFAMPVIKCLEIYDVTASFSGRNDILIDGKKFSGNAQYFYKDKVLHHGTLLFSSDLTVLAKALKVRQDKFESKGIKSMQSRVANIGDYIDKDITLAEFRQTLIRSMFDYEQEPVRHYDLTAEDITAITELEKQNTVHGTGTMDNRQSRTIRRK